VDNAGRAVEDSSWSVRVVPNLYPALDSAPKVSPEPGDLFQRRDGYGAHEVVVVSPRHDRPLGELSPDQAVRVLEVCRLRLRALAADERIAYVLLFKNRGRAAGASLSHPHLQILATPLVPDLVSREREAVRQYRERTGGCLFCDLVYQETGSGQRMILDNGDFVAMAPYASRVPFEILILPRAHPGSFTDLEPARLPALAEILQGTLNRLDLTLDRPPFNLVLHTDPPRPGGTAREETGHWHVEILPRLVRLGGFEWGAGIHINPVPPEEAAHHLRTVSLTTAAPTRPNRPKPPPDA
jgi:UDPglucose--hexose-1-phosphate uridylyltransferase